MQAIELRPKVHVSADGSGVVGHAGARLLADLADVTGLTAAYSAALRSLRPRGTGAAPTYKGGFGFHPLLCFLANTGEAVSGQLRPGNSGANTAADHIAVLDQALAQIPDAHRHGIDILIRADSAGSPKAFPAHVRDLRKQGVRTFFSVGYAITEPVRRAIWAMPDRLWQPALDQDGTLRDGAEAAELTGMVDLGGYPTGTRIIVRRERPHPGAQLSLFDQDEGLRHQVFLTDTPYSGGGSAQFQEVRHRGHATVEDHIRCGKTTGFGRFPSRDFTVNAVRLELSLAAIDLLAWTRVLLLTGSWPLPSRRSFATGCCTLPPASPAAADACAYGYRRPGPGETNWPRPSIASPHCPARRLRPANP